MTTRKHLQQQTRLSVYWLSVVALGITCVLPPFTLQAAELNIEIDGIEDEELLEQLVEVAETEMAEEEIPESESALRQLARHHLSVLQKLMRAEAYYNAEVSLAGVTIEDSQIHYRINPGTRFKYNQIILTVTDPENDYKPHLQSILTMVKGEPARAQEVLDAISKLRDAAREAGYPRAEAADPEATVDHALGSMDIEFKLQSGPFGKLALPTYEGLATVRETALMEKVPWKAGERYQPILEEQLKSRLLEARLFSIVRIKYGEQPNTNGLLPVNVELKERKHRTLKAGIRYHSDEGPGTSFGWQHRNLFGGGELLDLNLEIATEAQVFDARFRKPDFYRLDQALVTSLSLEKRSTDAFDSIALDTGIGIERRLAPKMDVSAGIGFRLSEVEQQGEKESFGLLYLPLGFKWDNSNNELDPTSGFRIQLDGAPYTDLFNDGVSFIRLYGRYSHYLQVMDSPRTVLAGRLTLGSLAGVSRERIPPDIRFYAGGGGSVRGLGFQLASPLNANNDPLGGRSLFELALETRVRITENIGIVAFVDAGEAYESEYPDFEQDPQLGAGLGLRYHTPIGPVRLDVGKPLNKREGIDKNFQIYISLGQAF